MIIGSDIPLEIGKRYVGLMNDKGKHVKQPHIIIREATKEEFIQQFIDLEIEMYPQTQAKLNDLNSKYYEISTD